MTIFTENTLAALLNSGKSLIILIAYISRLEDLADALVCLFGFLTSSSTTRLYRGRAPRQSV